MGAVEAVTDQNFTDEVLKSTTPVVVDFWATWCTQCPAVDRMIASLAIGELADRVRFVKMDVDTSPETAQQYRVTSLPTLIIFRNGEPVGSIPGLRPRRQVIDTIEAAIC